MAPEQQKWRPRQTLIDMYNERDKVEWYWRLLAVLSSSLILLGFMVFPASFSASTSGQTPSGTLSIIAVILLALGYSLSVALWFICTSRLFQFDVIFMPCLGSCVLGVLNVGINLGVHTSSGQWSTAAIAALTLALASSLIYAILALLIYRKIDDIRARDRLGARQRGGSDTANLLPDEQQRQQLLRLLQQKEDKNKVSPSQSTFKIDIPENLRAARNLRPEARLSRSPIDGQTSYLAAPSATYESSRGRDPLSLDEQFGLLDGGGYDRRQAALDMARERSRARSRENSSPGPHAPVIVNTRLAGEDASEIPLSERHPLEREEFIRGQKAKEEYTGGGVYRPASGDYDTYREEDAGPTYEIVEGEQIEVDLERGLRRPEELDGVERRELEATALPKRRDWGTR